MSSYDTPSVEAIDRLVAKNPAKSRDNHRMLALYGYDDGQFNRVTTSKKRFPLRRREWIESFIKIRDESAKIVLLKTNVLQRQLECAILRMERARRPVRIIILKARKMGACLSPETRVLTSDLRWVTLSEISVGDSLFGVDENSPGGKGAARKTRVSIVEAKIELREEAFEIVMNSGVVIATADHRFLVRNRGGSEQIWRKVAKLRVGDHIRHVVSPWDGPASYEDGWFGGIIDGEGHLRWKDRGGIELNVTQNPGAVLDRAVAYLDAHGYHYDVAERDNGLLASKASVYRFDEALEIVGRTRPSRYVDKHWWNGKELPGKRIGFRGGVIESIRSIGVQPVIDLQTSTKTFIAEGVVSHNSTYIEAIAVERSVRRPNSSALIIAHDEKTARKILKMAQTMCSFMPKSDKERFTFDMLHEALSIIAWKDPIRSEIEVASANKNDPARGFTPDYFHGSEHAFYEDAENTLQSALNSLPNLISTMAFIESTANGDYGSFRDRFKSAWALRDVPIRERNVGDDAWFACFFPWICHPNYRWTVTYGNCRDLPRDIVEQIKSNITEAEETLLKQRYLRRWQPDDPWIIRDGRPARMHVGWRTVDYDQLAWRRQKIRESGGDPQKPDTWDRFKEEFPAFPEEAFLATGRLFFDDSAIQQGLLQCREPIFRGELIDTKTDLETVLVTQEDVFKSPEASAEKNINANADLDRPHRFVTRRN